MSTKDFLKTSSHEIQSEFHERRTLLSFDEYLDAALKRPQSQIRNAAQYLKDAIDSFGSHELPHPTGVIRRFHIFDLHDGDSTGRVSGQEEAQNAIYRVIASFCQMGRVNKFMLLHGPNGSAKSSLVEALKRGLEQYSHTEPGALYSFNWIFPKEKIEKQNIGFGGTKAQSTLETFAFLEADAIEVKISSSLKEHPLLVLPRAQREKLFAQLPREVSIPDNLRVGELSLKNRKIADALLQSYAGDWLKVLRHIQVERFYVSRRYQVATALVEPQMSVDAGLQQVTADRTQGNVPPALQNLALFEPQGALVNAHRGLIEYSDLLKRPLEAYKYLLGFSESQEVPLEHVLLELDEVLIASSNEKHLDAFKQIPDFPSFKGRVELIRVPYLRQWKAEQEIYDAHVNQSTVGVPVAPHSTRLAAMWAVLTRLKKPQLDRYDLRERALLEKLSPFEKLELYQSNEAPARLTQQEKRELKGLVPKLFLESESFPYYEGRLGASAREVKTALLNASQSKEYQGLHPLGVLAELKELVADKSVYEFLQQEVVEGYHAHAEFIGAVERHYLDVIDTEVRESLGLVTEKQYRELFERYVSTVSAWSQKAMMSNKHTGQVEKPDEARMEEFERLVMAKNDELTPFRRSLISKIGAWKIDHPSGTVDYAEIFPDLFLKLAAHFFEERKRSVKVGIENMLKKLFDESLDPKSLAETNAAFDTLCTRFAYTRESAKHVLVFLLKHRYS
jgi:serine protein kinase